MDPISLTDLINELLDKLFAQSAGPMLAQVKQLALSPTGAMQIALRELEEEALRLDILGEMMRWDNPVLLKTVNTYRSLMIQTQDLILANAGKVEATGQAVAPPAVTSKVFLGASTEIVTAGGNPILSLPQLLSTLDAKGIPWRVPSDVGRQVAKFVDTAAWIERMEGWGEGYANLIRDTLLEGIQKGWGPGKVAETLRLHATNIPQSAAENLTRTLQLTAYREASLAMEKINGRFIIKKIRIASLDHRTCLTCISLHGTELAPGQRVDDHYRGRCSEYYVVPGAPEHPSVMQADSPKGGRRYVPWQTGEDWFRGLPTDRQRQQISFLKSPGKWNAYTAGNPLSSFIAEHHDSVFGRQVIENSIVGSFGPELAQQYYVK